MSDISDRCNDLPPRAVGVPDTGQGLFQKFEVRRTDGSSEPGGKHEGCEYFVLDTDHDTYAKVALAAYADACERTHPLLARDLRLRHHLPENEHVVRVPIGINFDAERTVGWVQIHRDALPPTPDWCIAIAYSVTDRTQHPSGRTEITGYRLLGASITSDSDYERVIDREKGRRLTDPTEHVVQALRDRAIGIARDVADAFAKRRNDGSSTETLFVRLADELLREPELLKAIAMWHAAALHQVDGGQPQAAQPAPVAWVPVHPRTGELWSMTTNDPSPERLPNSYPLRGLVFATPPTEPAQVDWPECSGDPSSCPENEGYGCCNRLTETAPPAEPAARPAWEDASATERTHARRLLARHCSLELRATLSAHQEEWWRLNREREASEADILQVLAAGLSASRVEPDRRPKSGMVLSHGGHRSTGLGPVVIDATARWAGAHQDVLGTWEFSEENWQKFVDALSEPQPGERA